MAGKWVTRGTAETAQRAQGRRPIEGNNCPVTFQTLPLVNFENVTVAGSHMFSTSIGAHYLGDGRSLFRVWAASASRVDLRLLTPHEKIVPLSPLGNGYYGAEVADVPPGTRYLFRLDGDKERPDPASRFQPQGVHGPSQVVDSCFAWEDKCWFGLPLEQYIIYELHVGTFTAEGTFEAIIPYLPELKELGVTAVEIMPVAQFPGDRNWGYDGVYAFAVQNSYGGPEGLKRLINACHKEGLAVILDVVYNHLGPEGNYLNDFGPYFTERYKTPWGPALNFDGAESDPVRRYFIENSMPFTPFSITHLTRFSKNWARPSIGKRTT
jgi:maltooligosyltrehalose trehalohydrolase